MGRWRIGLIVLVLAGCSGSVEPSIAPSGTSPSGTIGAGARGSGAVEVTGSDGQTGAQPTVTGADTAPSDSEGSSPTAPDVASSGSPAGPTSGDPSDLRLEAGGVIQVFGRSSLSMDWRQARDAVSAVLGPPQRTSAVGEVCDTHVMPGFAITWKNLRVLVQSRESDNEYLGNVRLGRIVGWEVWEPTGANADEPVITPPLGVAGGVGLGSRLSAVRAAYPKGRLFQGDGDVLWHVGSDLGNDLSFHFTDDGGSARPYFIASGYACGS